jgi:hypothetical protein
MPAYAKQPLPRAFMLPLLACGFVGFVVQIIYSARKGVIFWGHADDGGYKMIYRAQDPRRFRMLLWVQAALALFFLAGLIFAIFQYPTS